MRGFLIIVLAIAARCFSLRTASEAPSHTRGVSIGKVQNLLMNASRTASVSFTGPKWLMTSHRRLMLVAGSAHYGG